MKKLMIAGAVAALLTIAGAAMSDTNMLGQTGTTLLPTASVQAAKQVNAAYNYWKANGIDFNNYSAVYGIGSGIEGGAFYSKENDDSSTKDYGLSLKKAFSAISGFTPALGATYIHEKSDIKSNGYQVYGVLSRELTSSDNYTCNGNLGVNYTRIKPSGYDSVDATRVFASLEFKLNNGATIIGEYQTKSSDIGDDKAVSAITIKYPITSQISIKLGETNSPSGLVGTDTHRMFYGLDVNF